MATWSGASFGGWDPIASWFEGGLNRVFNRQSYDDQFWYSALNAQHSLENNPSYAVKGLEKAGLNPILAANSAAGASSTPVQALPIGSNSHSGFGSSSPFDWSARRAEKEYRERQTELLDLSGEKLEADIDTQRALQNLYGTMAERNRFVPISETDSGGLNILGSGFNFGGTDTLLFDTRSGALVRPKSVSSADSQRGAPVSPRPSSSARSYYEKHNGVSPALRNALEKRGISLESLFNHAD